MIDIVIYGNELYKSLKMELLCYSLIHKYQYQAHLEKITEKEKIDKKYRNSLPVLIINNKVYSKRDVPSKDQIKSWIDELLGAYFY